MNRSQLRFSCIFGMVSVILCMLLASGANAQLFYNNGATVYVNTNAIVQVNGDAQNANTGLFTNLGDVTITGNITNDATAGGSGTYHVAGNWINNSVFNGNLGTVELNGAAQQIAGTAVTHFYDLLLTGTGIKTLAINSYADNLLALNDRELATNAFTMFVDATGTGAITRTTGFVSSLAGGNLSRATANAALYLFPVGSSVGTLRYRPVNITPASANADTYTVRMVNNDATTDGYDRTHVDSTICATLANYYHLINRTSGTDAADVGINYDPVNDGNWLGIANWKTPLTQWQTVGAVTVAGNFVTKAAWNNYTYLPYILTTKKANATIFPVTPQCANNPTLTITAVDGGGQWSGAGVNPGTGVFDPSTAGAGDHVITYTISGACGDTSTITVRVYSIPVIASVANNTSCLTATDGSIDLTVTSGTSPYSYTWNNSLPPDANQSNLAPNVYMVIVTDNNNCSVTQSFDILAGTNECIPEAFYVPDVFSPNDDLVNDFFRVRGHGIKTLSVIIYDRWGEKVWTSSDPDQTEGWDGTFRGKKMDAGVFVYYITAVMNSGMQYNKKGNITLVR